MRPATPKQSGYTGVWNQGAEIAGDILEAAYLNVKSFIK